MTSPACPGTVASKPPVAVSTIRIVPSLAAVARDCPSGATANGPAERNVEPACVKSSGVVTSQMASNPSRSAVANCRPFGEKARLSIRPVCPLNSPSAVMVRIDNSRTVVSSPAVASQAPPGEKARARTVPPCAANDRDSRVSRSQTVTMPPGPPAATRRPSSEIASTSTS